jgi:hypothetical protein
MAATRGCTVSSCTRLLLAQRQPLNGTWRGCWPTVRLGPPGLGLPTLCPRTPTPPKDPGRGPMQPTPTTRQSLPWQPRGSTPRWQPRSPCSAPTTAGVQTRGSLATATCRRCVLATCPSLLVIPRACRHPSRMPSSLTRAVIPHACRHPSRVPSSLARAVIPRACRRPAPPPRQPRLATDHHRSPPCVNRCSAGGCPVFAPRLPPHLPGSARVSLPPPPPD